MTKKTKKKFPTKKCDSLVGTQCVELIDSIRVAS